MGIINASNPTAEVVSVPGATYTGTIFEGMTEGEVISFVRELNTRSDKRYCYVRVPNTLFDWALYSYN